MTRKFEELERKRAEIDVLQWGRVIDDAEIAAGKSVGGQFVMLQWGRVIDDAEISRPWIPTWSARSRFNGAASLMTRKWPASQLAVAQRLTGSFSSGSDYPAIGKTWQRCFSFRKYVLVNRFERWPEIVNHWTTRNLYITITLAGGV